MMIIEEELIKIQSKTQSLRVAEFIGADRQRFNELMHHFFSDNTFLSHKASMVVGLCVLINSYLLDPYIEKMIQCLNHQVNDALTRNILRTFQFVALPEKYWGEVWEIGYQYLTSPKKPIAIRVFAMTVLVNICKHLPELKQELQIAIEDQLPFGSAGFVSRGKKSLNILKRL